MALITLDNGHDHTRPNTFGPGWPDLAARGAGLGSPPGGPWRHCRGRRRREAVHLRGRRGPDRRRADRLAGRGAGHRQAGHAVFRRLGELGVPSFAFVNGAALGGGLELALHCSYRTISSGVTAVALPECFLGLLPGRGGTYLLPHLIGPARALKVIVENPLGQNRMLNGSQAFMRSGSPTRCSSPPTSWPNRSAGPPGSFSGSVLVTRDRGMPRTGTRRPPERGCSRTASCTAPRPPPTGPSSWWPRRAAGPATRGSPPRTKSSPTCCSAMSCGPGSTPST